MTVKKYNKLIRDKIPEIIESTGNTCKIEVLNGEDYLTFLENKLEEELVEYKEEGKIEELIDIIEVIYAISQVRGYSVDDLERVRMAKLEKNGGFVKKLRLLEVNDMKNF